MHKITVLSVPPVGLTLARSYSFTFDTQRSNWDRDWRGSSKGSCSVKYFFMGISIMLVVWIGTFMMMVE
jgi:hypothetical protein